MKNALFKAALKFIIPNILAAFLLLWPFHFAVAAAYLTLNGFSGHPTALKVSGGGWVSGETVSVYVGDASGSPAATSVVGKNNSFGPVTVSIPANAPQGRLGLVAVGSVSKVRATNSYYVVPYGPSLTAAVPASTPGSVITASGSGFAPGEDVNLTIGEAKVASAKADSKGNFGKVKVTIPQLAAGTYHLVGTGASSGASTDFFLYVGSFYPQASPSNYFILPGQSVSFNGYGFAPGESVQVYEGLNPSPLASFTADSQGKFSKAGSVTVPITAALGSTDFHLRSNVTHADLPFLISIGKFNALVKPDNYFVRPGQAVKFYGKGFAPGEQVSILQGKAQNVLGTITADKNGSFSGLGTITIPYSSAGGQINFSFIGKSSSVSADTAVSVGTFTPQIAPSQYYLFPGKSFTIWGTGFAPNEKVGVTSGGVTLTVATDKFGVFKTAGPFAVPAVSTGEPIHVVASGQNSLAVATADLTEGQLHPLIIPSNYYLHSGNKIKFTGVGFLPGETVDITGAAGPNEPEAEGDVANLGSVTANKDGVFISDFYTTAFGPTRKRVYTFVGEKSQATATTNIGIAELAPLAQADNYYLPSGFSLKVRGGGFASGENVSITGGASPVVAAATVDGEMPWTKITVPFGVATTTPLIVTLTGNSSKASAQVSIGVAPFLALVSPSTYYAVPGKEVSFNGNGFAPNEQIAVNLNGQPLGFVTTDAQGNFSSKKISVPVTSDKAAIFGFLGSKSNAAAGIKVSLAPFNPQIYPSAFFTSPGSKITFKGLGFAPTETVNILQGEAVIQTLTVPASGNFVSAPITLPMDASSMHFAFSSSISNVDEEINVGLSSFNPQVYPSNYYVTPGSNLTFKGLGFAPGETVNIYLDKSSIQSLTVPATGNFISQPIPMPFDTTSMHFAFSSSISHAANIVDIGLSSFNTQVYPSSYYAAPGSKITFKGFGFSPGEQVGVNFNQSDLGKVIADGKGNFVSTAYLIPFGSQAAHFSFNGEKSNKPATVDIAVATLKPVLSLSSYYDSVGKPLTIKGQGFGPSENVSVSFGGVPAGSIAADAKGNFSLKITTPSGPPGNVTVSATGADSAAAATATFSYAKLHPVVQLNVYSGKPGSAITFIGTGFAPGETVNVTTDRTGSAAVQSFTADDKGNFKNTGYKLPADFTAGQLTFTVAGAQSMASRSIVYYVAGPP